MVRYTTGWLCVCTWEQGVWRTSFCGALHWAMHVVAVFPRLLPLVLRTVNWDWRHPAPCVDEEPEALAWDHSRSGAGMILSLTQMGTFKVYSNEPALQILGFCVIIWAKFCTSALNIHCPRIVPPWGKGSRDFLQSACWCQPSSRPLMTQFPL